MSRKFVVEIEDKIYEELQKAYQEVKNLGAEPTFEEFVSEILSQYVNVKNQAGNLFGKFSKAMLENFDPSQLDEMLSSFKNMSDMFDNKTKKPTTDESSSSDPKTQISNNATKKKS